ncbi:3' terminal RNA ribose 2'-O-methyltransferase Hen1 [Flavilitoribacter nigricans]|uniref:Small RNA 2'-O-methyltransferase n=1 Tax=Flavilitoribacter nigricans (strain ATCC 23147 / DSM 23189 / NBRC 102662 / NCIMB 1420 / SS-2) TaxID=1122177 RepID=A0A2D0N501_FLAN2|nr:3' terminal RNA ribose 2'-O-methyltransferase Hen1 [Flavilitoribacter nigricans]PHN03612.1 3' terminal RNA ribose 2'-O-methyltransferase Hen1 [Flavilitoribacter nigricans DSM 23189 = NBRC 102662]
MFLEISTTHQPATDLGFLLGKHPDRLQSRDLSFGKAHIFYPEATAERCSVVLLLEIDAIALSRNMTKTYADSFQLGHYVNDRPYTASSFMTTAISKVFGSALNGNCKERPELVEQPLPLEVTISALSSRGGETLIRRFFEPLGYELALSTQLLDPEFPNWGDSPYFRLQLRHHISLQELLMQLYVLIPALDNNKHYFVGSPEVNKLLDKAGSWLETHPELPQIARRYLRHQKSLTTMALEKLQDEDSAPHSFGATEPEARLEQNMSLHQIRHQAVLAVLQDAGLNSILDLGCGGGKFLKLLLSQTAIPKVTGVDVSYRYLEIAKKRLHWDVMPPMTRARIELLHGALTYRDDRLQGYDAAVAIEVIEHLDPNRLRAFEQSVFLYAQPGMVVITTPNIEYNRLFENMKPGSLRHSDHRFEWTRAEFADWTQKVATTYSYRVTVAGIGPEDARYGCPSQMAIFQR